jgi:zincin-like metallopeptidase
MSISDKLKYTSAFCGFVAAALWFWSASVSTPKYVRRIDLGHLTDSLDDDVQPAELDDLQKLTVELGWQSRLGASAAIAAGLAAGVPSLCNLRRDRGEPVGFALVNQRTSFITAMGPSDLTAAPTTPYPAQSLMSPRPRGAAFPLERRSQCVNLRRSNASYIASWIKVLKDDKRAIFTAASHAQRAADFLHGLQQSASAQADAA